MNPKLQDIFSSWYHPSTTNNKVDGASSKSGTQQIRKLMIELFDQYQIKKIFDAGCNDCNWMYLLSEKIEYQGGDISPSMIAGARADYPGLNVAVHDITSDPIPSVDLLFVRDVAIHLNNQDRLKLWKNWYNSSVPWILITHIQDCLLNNNIEYVTDQFPFSAVNWELDPWNFSKPTDLIDEYGPNGRCLALWHRDQFKEIL
jgi:hypothetical protein